MKRSLRCSTIALLASLPLITLPAFSADLQDLAPNTKGLQVVPVDPTPMPENVELKLVFPTSDEFESGKPLRFQARLDWLPLGVDSDFDRKREIYNSPRGQTLHVFVDNRDYFTVNEALFDALDDHDEYFTQTADFVIPFKLDAGMHVLRMFPCRSFGESLKSNKAYVATAFYYKKRDNQTIDLSLPYLTYNEPQGTYKGNQPILLDFFVSNCVLSRDGYKVRITIDGENQRTLTQWVPYYIYGLKSGKHKIRLELLDPQNKIVSGPFNNVEKTISIK